MRYNMKDINHILAGTKHALALETRGGKDRVLRDILYFTGRCER